MHSLRLRLPCSLVRARSTLGKKKEDNILYFRTVLLLPLCSLALLAPACAAHSANIPLPVPTSSTVLPANNSALSMIARHRLVDIFRDGRGGGGGRGTRVLKRLLLLHSHPFPDDHLHLGSRLIQGGPTQGDNEAGKIGLSCNLYTCSTPADSRRSGEFDMSVFLRTAEFELLVISTQPLRVHVPHHPHPWRSRCVARKRSETSFVDSPICALKFSSRDDAPRINLDFTELHCQIRPRG